MRATSLQDPMGALRLLLYQAAFFETATDTEMDPDVAVKLLEQFRHSVNEWPEADRRTLLDLAHEEAARPDQAPAVRRFLLGLDDNIDLPTNKEAA